MLKALDFQHLADHGFVVVEDFISTELQEQLLEDVRILREHSKFHVAKIGHNGQIQDEQTPFRDIRYSETCFIGRSALQDDNENINSSNNKLLLNSTPARETLYQVLDQLRDSLSQDVPPEGRHTRDVPPLDRDLEELMYAYYPQGGYYRRHLDAERHSMSNWRKYSLVLYLNRRDWPSELGGQLRLHRDSGGDVLPTGELPNFLDVDPRGGTLVLFRSDLVPHEVLDTQMDRIAIVGWFLSKEDHLDDDDDDNNEPLLEGNNTGKKNRDNKVNRMATTTIHPEALANLRALRDACPRLKAKLEPVSVTSQSQQNSNHISGLLTDNDLFWFPESLAAATALPNNIVPPTTATTNDDTNTAPPIDDTDPNYWKSIVSLDCQGYITTLSLSGQRLRHLLDSSVNSPHSNLFASLFRHVVTLDLGNTDLGMSKAPSETVPLVQVLQGIRAENTLLKQIHLGGNGLRQPGPVLQVLAARTHSSSVLTTLDLRYNDMGPQGVQQIADYLLSSDTPTCHWQVLFLEGNQIGDAGAIALATALSSGKLAALRELYLGQNDIGPDGAAALAKSFANAGSCCLRKLYLEGNRIGTTGARAFIQVLQGLGSKSTLEKLYVDNNGIDKSEAVLLGKTLNSATMMGDGGLFQE